MNTRIPVAVGLAAVIAAVFTIPTVAFAADVNVDITPGSSNKSTDAYAPNPVEVNVGDTVIWTNKDSQPHTVTSGSNSVPDGKFDSSPSFNPLIVQNGQFKHTFEEAGEFPYYCGLHPVMVGTVIVSGGGDGGPQESTATLTLEGNSYEVTAVSETAMVTGGEIEPVDKVVTLTFDAAGAVEVTLPKTMIDGISAVRAGDQNVEFEPADAGNSTKLTFTIPEGQTEVEVVGSFVVPEFPVIAALVLGITVAAIVGVTRFAKTSTSGLFGRV